MQKLNVVILAAGQGKRMYSSVPKVLHKIGNKPMLCHVIDAARTLHPNKIIIVYGHGGDVVRQVTSSYYANLTHGVDAQHITNNAFTMDDVIWVHQDKQLGTGHALKCALPHIDEDAATLLLYGDVPLIASATLEQMCIKYINNIVMLTASLDNQFGYGRVLRDKCAKVVGIVEEKDASDDERKISEVNSGIYILPGERLSAWLNNLSNNNSQGEYYITDVIAMAHNEGMSIDALTVANNYEIMGVNNKVQLEYLERVLQRCHAEKLLIAGATIIDKSRIDIRGELTVGMDVTIDINCIFEGIVTLGNNVNIGASCILKNVVVADNVEIKPYSVIEDAVIGNDSQVGPFARIRPGTKLTVGAHIGNFVEIKNSTIGAGSKVNHLTYIGDTEMGAKVNVGAGSVTCNYDGKNKFKTIIEDNVFVGSGTMMVAPVKLGSGGIIGAGSTITKNTPENELTIARAKQLTVPGWMKKHHHKE